MEEKEKLSERVIVLRAEAEALERRGVKLQVGTRARDRMRTNLRLLLAFLAPPTRVCPASASHQYGFKQLP